MFTSEQGSSVPVGLAAGEVWLLWNWGGGLNKADAGLPDDWPLAPATCPRDPDAGVQMSLHVRGHSGPVLSAQKVQATHVSADGQMERPAGVRAHGE